MKKAALIGILILISVSILTITPCTIHAQTEGFETTVIDTASHNGVDIAVEEDASGFDQGYLINVDGNDVVLYNDFHIEFPSDQSQSWCGESPPDWSGEIAQDGTSVDFETADAADGETDFYWFEDLELTDATFRVTMNGDTVAYFYWTWRNNTGTVVEGPELPAGALAPVMGLIGVGVWLIRRKQRSSR